MKDPIIDREEAVKLFHELLDSKTPTRFMRLLGEAKMGKTHLLTRILPRLAEQRDMECAVIDLRNRQITIVEHLHHIRSQLGTDRFERFNAAYDDWINRPQIQTEGLQAVLSVISMRSRSEEDDAGRMIPHFTSCFVDDLRTDEERSVLLIFDAVEQADDQVRDWLMDRLLVQVHTTPHIHVVVGGRSIPDPAGSYHPICRSHELRAVTDHAAYFAYCRDLGLDLGEPVIEALANAFEYVPGNFANVLDKRFRAEGVGHD